MAPWFATSAVTCGAQLRKQWLHSSASTYLDCPLKLWYQSPQAREAQLNSFQRLKLPTFFDSNSCMTFEASHPSWSHYFRWQLCLDMNRTFQLLWLSPELAAKGCWIGRRNASVLLPFHEQAAGLPCFGYSC